MFNSFGTVISDDLISGGTTSLSNSQLNCAKAINSLYIEAEVGAVDSVELILNVSGYAASIAITLDNTITASWNVTFTTDRNVFELTSSTAVKRFVIDLTRIETDGNVVLPLYPSVVKCDNHSPQNTDTITISVKYPITLDIISNTIKLGLDYVGLVTIPTTDIGLTSINGVGVDPQGNINIISINKNLTVTTKSTSD